MDEETQIVSNNSRIANAKTFILNNKKLLITIFTLIILTIFGYFFYKEFEKKNRIKLSETYNNIITNFELDNKEDVTKELKEIIYKKDKTYSPLALYFLIDNSLINSKEEINKYFNIIIEETKLEKEIKNLIIYKKALYNSEFETEQNLLSILNPLINSESVWKSHALFLMAEYFFSKGEKQKSREFFQKILELKDANQNILLDTQKRIIRDFSE
tara:strand:- start:1649 stop:2293 length:645 start_codon:yes stop_codon:yes gene_type:complete